MRNSLKKEITGLLAIDTLYRNDDRRLILKVWQNHGLELTTAQRFVFMQIPGPDSILRRRRELSDTYPATAEITEKRFKHYKAYTEEFSKGHWFNKFLKRRGV